jgi:hypothetical protein
MNPNDISQITAAFCTEILGTSCIDDGSSAAPQRHGHGNGRGTAAAPGSFRRVLCQT